MDLLVFLFWVAVGLIALALVINPNFRSAVFARFMGATQQAARAVDDAVARVESAIVATERELIKANTGLREVKTVRKGIELQIAKARVDATKYKGAAEPAAQAGRRDLVLEALRRQQAAEARIAELEPQLEDVLARERQVQKAVTTLEERRVELQSKRNEIVTRARTAKVGISVNELLGGLKVDTRSADVTRAFEIVEELEASAVATAEMATEATADERLERELEALTRPSEDIESEADTLMAKYAPTTRPEAATEA